MFQNKENQGDTVEYTHVKDEAVKFHCTQNTDSFHTPRIQIISRGSVQILSFRLNKTECPWHWEGDWIIPDTEDENVKEIELLVISQGGKLDKNESPDFFLIDASGKQCYNLSYYINFSETGGTYVQSNFV